MPRLNNPKLSKRLNTAIIIMSALALTALSGPTVIAQQSQFFDLSDEEVNLITGENEWAPLGIGFGGQCGPSSGIFVGNNNAEIIWNYFRADNRGLTEQQTAAILGNYAVETAGTLDPAISQFGGGPGRGLAQWEKGGRWDIMEKYAAARSMDPFTLEAQLDFTWFEMTGEPEAEGVNGGYESGAYTDLLKQTTVEAATVSFARKFERNRLSIDYGKGKVDYETAFRHRIDAAEASFAEFAGTAAKAAAGGDCYSAGGQIVGDSLESSVDILCAAGTIDLGIHNGYVGGEEIPHRLCALPGFINKDPESEPGNAYYVSNPDTGEGADWNVIVNSRVSGAWYSLYNDAKSAGHTLGANSTFRTYPHQVAIWERNGRDRKIAARPGYSPHQSAVAIDFNWGGGEADRGASCENPSDSSSDQYDWMVENAYNYGFKQYAVEHWHWDTFGGSLRCTYQ